MTPQEQLCHCARTSRYKIQDSNYKNHSYDRCWTEKVTPPSEVNLTIEQVEKWAKSNAGATGVDMRGRRWVDLQDLLSFLTTLKK